MPDNKIFGTADAETITGTDARDMIYGYGGGDTIYGGGGNDVIYGGGEGDTLYGGDGDDQMSGGEGGDTMYGGAGNDIYYVQSVNDRVIEFSNEGTDTVVSYLANYRIGANIEQLFIGEGAAVDAAGRSNGTGNDLNNAMKGSSIGNNLHGGAGNDSIYGYGGNDIITGGIGNDKMAGGDGIDIVSFKDAANGVFVDLSRTSAYNTGVGTDTIIEFEDIEGSAFGDTLIGNGVANKIVAGGGGDILRGAGGDDYLVGGTGADRFYFDGTATNGVDRIADFTQGADKLYFFVADGYSATATLSYNVASGTGAQFVYVSQSQKLYYDADGAGGTDGVLIANLNENPPLALAMSDIVIV